jgi:hypothetical protein
MATIDVTTRDLITIVRQLSPPYEAMNHPLIKGTIDGSYGRWSWNVKFNELTELELVTMLALCTG